MILFCFTLSFALFIIHNESFNGALLKKILWLFSILLLLTRHNMDTCRANSGHGASDHTIAAPWWWPQDGSHLLRLSKPQTEAAAAGLGVDTVIAILRTARLVRKWADGRVSPNRGLRKSEYCCCCLLRWEFWDSECWITRLNVQLKVGNKLSCFCGPLT